jgi:crossover junction endodeoxyribonuclease RuvC
MGNPATRKRSPPPERVILGLDPGVAIVGYAVIREAGGALALLACDVIRTPPRIPLEDRLLSIYEQTCQLLAAHQPGEVAIEDLFFGKNRTTAMAVAHSRGVLMLAARQYGLAVAAYTPSQVKLAVTGYGSAEKGQVGRMVRELLNLSRIPRPDDAADAAAVAICHAHTTAWRTQLRQINKSTR